jgi:myo-inositol-1(or 4)-monophosphatase
VDLTSQELSRFADIAMMAALEAGAILEHYWGNVHQVRSKDVAGNLVTEADRASEKRILEFLGDQCPGHAVLAEESGAHGVKGAEFLWVVDPLDGTTNYAHRLPIVSVSIGLLYRGTPVAGVVYNPIQRNLFQAKLGGGAFLDGMPIHVSTVKSLSQSLLVSGFPYNRRETKDNNYAEF